MKRVQKKATKTKDRRVSNKRKTGGNLRKQLKKRTKDQYSPKVRNIQKIKREN